MNNKDEQKRCHICDDMDVFSEIVCYIPNENGSATDITPKFCPNCGRKIDWE